MATKHRMHQICGIFHSRYIIVIFVSLGKAYQEVDGAYCKFPLGKTTSSEPLISSYNEAETKCSEEVTCRMFYAPVKTIEEYFLCPYGSIVAGQSKSSMYVKPGEFC